MAKTSGLNVRCYVAGYDISGDANSLDGVGYSQNLMETTGLTQVATSRIIGLVDGNLGVNVFFEQTSEHAALLASNVVPTGDRVVTVPMGSAVGDSGIGLVAKQANYDVSNGGVSSPITAKASFSANGYAPEFGVMLTAHDDTHSSASNGTAVDNSASSSNGGAGYLQAFSLSSGTPTVKIQHSSDNSTFTDLITFTASTAISSEYKTVSGTVNRYIRVSSTGTFSNLKLACLFYRG
jgi:hypothetical protein